MMRKSTCVLALLAVVLLSEASALSFRRREMVEKPGHGHHHKHHAVAKKEPCKKKKAHGTFHTDVVQKAMRKGSLKAALKNFDLSALKPKKGLKLKEAQKKKLHKAKKQLHHFSAQRKHHRGHHLKKAAMKKQKRHQRQHHKNLRKAEETERKRLRQETRESPEYKPEELEPSEVTVGPELEEEKEPFEAGSYEDHGEDMEDEGHAGNDHEHYTDHYGDEYDHEYSDHETNDYDDAMDNTAQEAGIGDEGMDAVHGCMGEENSGSEAFEKEAMEGFGEDGCLEPPSDEEIVVETMTVVCHMVCMEHHEKHLDLMSTGMAEGPPPKDLRKKMDNCHDACEVNPFEVTPEEVQTVMLAAMEACAPSDAPNTPAPHCVEKCFGEDPCFEEGCQGEQWDAVGDCMMTFEMCMQQEICLMSCPGPDCREECGMPQEVHEEPMVGGCASTQHGCCPGSTEAKTSADDMCE